MRMIPLVPIHSAIYFYIGTVYLLQMYEPILICYLLKCIFYSDVLKSFFLFEEPMQITTL